MEYEERTERNLPEPDLPMSATHAPCGSSKWMSLSSGRPLPSYSNDEKWAANAGSKDCVLSELPCRDDALCRLLTSSITSCSALRIDSFASDMAVRLCVAEAPVEVAIGPNLGFSAMYTRMRWRSGGRPGSIDALRCWRRAEAERRRERCRQRRKRCC